MRIRSRGNEPVVDASAFVAPTAALVGEVSVGPRSREVAHLGSCQRRDGYV